MTFAEQLQKLRKESGVSQVALAEKIGISWRAYQTYERGEREPSLSTLIALADLYGISLDELACYEPRSHPTESTFPPDRKEGPGDTGC